MTLTAIGHGAAITTTTVAAPYFPSALLVAAAADGIHDLIGVDRDVMERDAEPSAHVAVDRFYLSVAPGVVGMRRVHMRPYGSDADPYRTRPGTLFEYDLADDDDDAPKRRILAWSRASRARFHKRMAELDLSPFEDAVARGHGLGMVTLTLPCHWLRIAPTGRAFKRLMDRFRVAWERATAAPLYAIWKMEFQRRGAPHLHVLAAIPPIIAGVPAEVWIGETWVRICAPQGRDHARMLRAHLPSAKRPSGVIDYSQRLTDPKRVSVYFGKHSAKTGDSKEYQHSVPREWRADDAGPGRFWGYWSLRPAVEYVEVAASTWWRARRILRGIDRGRQADHALRLRAAADVRGESLRRATLQSLGLRKTRRLRGEGGGWVLAGDAVLIAYDLARAVAPPG